MKIEIGDWKPDTNKKDISSDVYLYHRAFHWQMYKLICNKDLFNYILEKEIHNAYWKQIWDNKDNIDYYKLLWEKYGLQDYEYWKPIIESRAYEVLKLNYIRMRLSQELKPVLWEHIPNRD